MPATWASDRAPDEKGVAAAGRMTEQMRRFAEVYDGNGAASARKVGSSPKAARQNACNWLKHPEVKAIIKARQATEQAAGIRSREEIQAWWSKVMDSATEEMPVRLKASEMLAKSLGMFLDRVETTHRMALPAGLTVDELRALAARPLLTETVVEQLPAGGAGGAGSADDAGDEEEEDAELVDSGEAAAPG